jgi:hypothetical protein
MNLSNPMRHHNLKGWKAMNFNLLAGSGGRDRTGDLRIMIPPL